MRLFTILGLMFAAGFLLAPVAEAQRIEARLETSNDASFSEQTRSFTPEETVHVRIVTDSAADEVTLAVAPRGHGDAVVLTPEPGDGFYAARIAAADLAHESHWVVTGTVTVGDRTRRLTRPIRIGEGRGDPPGDRVLVEIEGVIEAVSDSSITVNGTEILVRDSTRIGNRRDTPTVLEVGTYVQVLATPVREDLLLALRIHIRRHDPNDVTASGRIEALEPDARVVVVASLRFHVTDETEILDRSGDPIAFSALEVGMPVRVRGTIVGDAVVANEIRVWDSLSVRGRLTAEVTEGDGFQVAGVSFIVDDRTRVAGRDALPEPGTRVAVGFRYRPDGGLYAEHIRIARANDARDSLIGTVMLDGDALAVSGIRVGLTDSTQIVNGDGDPVTLESGMRVRVLGDFSAGVVASVIQTRAESDVTGRVESRIGDAFEKIAGTAIALTDYTTVLDSEGVPVDLSVLTEGQLVEVLASQADSGLEADIVTILESSSLSTTVETTPDLPTGFVLKGNYPNPFNPSTTIAFELAESASVRLEVFDVMGRRVRTLATGTVPAGSHEASWDGRAASGIAVTSGIYLYRLTVGGVTQARSMLLLK